MEGGTKRRRPLVRSITKNRRLGDRLEVFVTINTRPGCFPSTNRGGALAGGVTKLVVIPAEAGRWGVICWEWSRTAGMGACCRGRLGA